MILKEGGKMKEHRIQFCERYDNLKEHTGIIVTTPVDVDIKRVIEVINGFVSDEQNVTQLMDEVSDGTGWSWEKIIFDAEIHLPIHLKGEDLHRRQGRSG